MDKQLNFRFETPPLPKGPLIEMTASEAEEFLLRRLQEEAENPKDALWQLARFYSHRQQHEKALARLRDLLRLEPDPEAKAHCVLAMGQTMEQANDYPAAIRYYKEAQALEPTNSFTWYFINNNLGYSLNMIARFKEGETYCRRAIAIDLQRHNAHKNLGVALAGLGAYTEAAECYVTATRQNASDARALGLLETLLAEHPELTFDFQDDLDLCRKAVEVARSASKNVQPTVVRGWRKRLFLWKARLRSAWRRVCG